jgi:hypothetical protein
MKMEECSSKTLVDIQQITWYYMTEDRDLCSSSTFHKKSQASLHSSALRNLLLGVLRNVALLSIAIIPFGDKFCKAFL